MSLRSRSGFARPYIAALSCLMRLTVPSTAPELYARVRPATTAFRTEPYVRRGCTARRKSDRATPTSPDRWTQGIDPDTTRPVDGTEAAATAQFLVSGPRARRTPEGPMPEPLFRSYPC